MCGCKLNNKIYKILGKMGDLKSRKIEDGEIAGPDLTQFGAYHSYLKLRERLDSNGFKVPYTIKWRYVSPSDFGGTAFADTSNAKLHEEGLTPENAAKRIVITVYPTVYRTPEEAKEHGAEAVKYYGEMAQRGIGSKEAQDLLVARSMLHEIGHARVFLENDANGRDVVQLGRDFKTEIKNGKTVYGIKNATENLFAECMGEAYAILWMRRLGYNHIKEAVLSTEKTEDFNWENVEKYGEEMGLTLDAGQNVVIDPKYPLANGQAILKYMSAVSHITGDIKQRALVSNVDLRNTVALEEEAKRLAMSQVRQVLRQGGVQLDTPEMKARLNDLERASVCKSDQKLTGYPELARLEASNLVTDPPLLTKSGIERYRKIENGMCETDVRARPMPK